MRTVYLSSKLFGLKWKYYASVGNWTQGFCLLCGC